MVNHNLVEKLNELSSKYIQSEAKALTFEVLAEDVALFSGAKFGIINIYNKEKNVTVTKAIAGSQSLVLQAMKTLGFSLVGKEYPLDDKAEKMLTSRKLTRFDNLHTLSENHLSRIVVTGLEKVLDMGPVYAMGLHSENEIFGDIILVYPNRGTDPKIFSPELIELLIRQISSVIIKKRIDTQKEILLKEIHHRVKNNLQIIKSILYMQRENSSIPAVKESLINTESRINSMALIHEFLYHSYDISFIQMDEYLAALVSNIREIYAVDAGLIEVRIETDEISLNIDKAIPCGIIINELVTNCFKYAFPGSRSGTVSISFIAQKNFYILTVEDNGASGITEVEEQRKAVRGSGLGTKLVTILSEQLHGKAEVQQTDKGTKVTITIPE